MAKTVQAVVLRHFRDAGTEAEYAEGQKAAFDEGAFENYRFAGLVRAADEVPAKAAPAT